MAQRPRVPRRIAAVTVAAIALASVLALLWPSLPFTRTERLGVGPTGIGVITRQVDVPESAARIGSLAPDFEWTAPPGKAVRLSDLRGKGVVINFWATWCGPCRMVAPVLEEIASESETLKIAKLDVDANPITAGRFGVRAIPTMILFKEGKEAQRLVGYMPKERLLQQIAQHTHKAA
ncbi:MAG: thioredoxin [Candidatus Limnocylindria bacterium]